MKKKVNLILPKDRRTNPKLRHIPKWLLMPVMGMLFLSVVPAWFYAFWLAHWVGISDNVPVKEAPHGTLFMVLFLSGFVFILSVGYVLGFVIDALLLRYGCGWSWEKIKALMLYSEIPPEWQNKHDHTIR